MTLNSLVLKKLKFIFNFFKSLIRKDWIKFVVPVFILTFTIFANIVEANSYYNDIQASSAIDPATKTFILGEIDQYTPIIEERRDIDRLSLAAEEEDFILRKPTLVYTEITPPDAPPIEENRTAPLTHVVASGETLSNIGEKYNLKMKTILAANQTLKNADSLQIGDKLLIPIEDYDSNYADKLLAKKNAKFNRETTGSQKSTGIVYSNGSSISSTGSSSCLKPISYRYVSRRLSSFHKGVDMIASTGTPIYASCSGTIVNIAGGWSGGFGLHVKIRQDNGDQATYAHMSSISNNIAVGQSVEAGTFLGGVGSTGRSTGPHLHFEVVRNGRAIDYGM